jgi:hypothetical protein
LPFEETSLHYFHHHPHVYENPLQTIFCSVLFSLGGNTVDGGNRVDGGNTVDGGLVMGSQVPSIFRSYPTGQVRPGVGIIVCPSACFIV